MEWKSEINSKIIYGKTRNSTYALQANKNYLLHSFVFQNDMFQNVNLSTICKNAEYDILYDNRNTFVFPSENQRSEKIFSNELYFLQKHNAMFSSEPYTMCLKCVSATYASKDLVSLNLLGKLFLTSFQKAMRRFQTKQFSPSIEYVVKTHKDSLFLEGLCRFQQEDDDELFKGIGKKMVLFCILEAKKQNKSIFLTIFDYPSDNDVHNSHNFLLNYYTNLGFTFVCIIKHLYSDIQYTLMRLR